MSSLAALRNSSRLPWRVSLAYSYAQQKAQPPAANARTIKAFGDVGNQVLSLGVAYWFGAWSAQAQLPFGVSSRSQAGLSRARVWGLGDLRLQFGRLWELLGGPHAIRMIVQVGIAVPSGRFKAEDEIEASYLEPNANTGALTIRRVRAQTGLGSGNFAGIASLSVGQRWHRRLRGIFSFDAGIPLSSTKDGQRWGADLQARALLELLAFDGRVFATFGPDWLFHGADRWRGLGLDPANGVLDLELASRQRWGLRAGVGGSILPGLSCALQGIFPVWQSAEAGVLRETLGGQVSCQWAFGKERVR